VPSRGNRGFRQLIRIWNTDAYRFCNIPVPGLPGYPMNQIQRFSNPESPLGYNCGMTIFAMFPMPSPLDEIIVIAIWGLLIWGIIAAVFGWWQRFVDRRCQTSRDQGDADCVRSSSFRPSPPESAIGAQM